MADNYVQLNPDSTGKKLRTYNLTVNAQDVHQQYTINADETTGNAARVLNAQPASTDYALAVRPILPAKTMRTIYAQGIAGVTTEALATIQSVLNFAAASGATTQTVTSGKTFKIVAVALTNRNTAAAATWTRINIRVNTGGTATATSPIAYTIEATSPAATAATGEAVSMAVPEGLDIPSGASFGVSHLSSATTAAWDLCAIGYEF